jgi:hypothetical protein
MSAGGERPTPRRPAWPSSAIATELPSRSGLRRTVWRATRLMFSRPLLHGAMDACFHLTIRSSRKVSFEALVEPQRSPICFALVYFRVVDTPAELLAPVFRDLGFDTQNLRARNSPLRAGVPDGEILPGEGRGLAATTHQYRLPEEPPMPAKVTVEQTKHIADSLNSEPDRMKIAMTVLADRVRELV